MIVAHNFSQASTVESRGQVSHGNGPNNERNKGGIKAYITWWKSAVTAVRFKQRVHKKKKKEEAFPSKNILWVMQMGTELFFDIKKRFPLRREG